MSLSMTFANRVVGMNKIQGLPDETIPATGLGGQTQPAGPETVKDIQEFERQACEGKVIAEKRKWTGILIGVGITAVALLAILIVVIVVWAVVMNQPYQAPPARPVNAVLYDV